MIYLLAYSLRALCDHLRVLRCVVLLGGHHPHPNRDHIGRPEYCRDCGRDGMEMSERGYALLCGRAIIDDRGKRAQSPEFRDRIIGPVPRRPS
jgi:hypothetical protein